MKKKVLSIATLLLICILTILTLNACKKDCTTTTSSVTTKHTIDGLWVGTYLNNNLTSVPKQYQSITIYPNGEMLTNGLGGNTRFIATGNWVLNGSSFSANVSNIWSSTGNNFQSYHYTAVYDSINGSLTNGTWQDVNTTASSGTFDVIEVQ